MLFAQDPDDSLLLFEGKRLSTVLRCDVVHQALLEYALGRAGDCNPIFEPFLVTRRTNDFCRIAAVIAIGLEKSPEDHDARLSLAAWQGWLGVSGSRLVFVVVHVKE